MAKQKTDILHHIERVQNEIHNTIEASNDSIQELARNLQEIEQIESNHFNISKDMI
jgi:hypothetical protein